MPPKSIDSLYNKLLETYTNKSQDEFIKESKKIKDITDDFEGYDGYIPYPEYDNDNFNRVIYSKKEFNRNKLPTPYGKYAKDFDKTSEEKCSMTNFTLTPNQMFIKGFMSPVTPYNGLLLYHSVGVGKTCTAISIAEQYHDVYEKKVLVILSSTLIDNFKKQIFDITKYDIKNNTANLCVGTKYPDMVIDKNKMDKETLEKKINKLINEKYQFIGYKELAILMDKIRTKIEQYEVYNDPEKVEKIFNERLSEIFSDRLIIIDEAHNLRNPSETGKKQISTAFKTLLKHVTNVKLVLLTATPMFNNAKEIVWTLNLLLTNDKRPEITSSMIFDKQGELTEQGKEILIKVSRGYVSYMRGENPFSFPFRLFPSINKDENKLQLYPKKDIYGKKILKESQIKYLEIITSNMSNYQKEIYDVLKNKLKKITIDEDDIDEDEDAEDGGNKDESINNDLQNTMQVSNIVYPSLTYNDFLKKKTEPSKDLTLKDMKKFFGASGIESCFNRNDKGKLSYNQDIKKTYGEFLSFSEIDKYAPKMKRIIDYIINSNGIVFVYSRYYASGIIPLALALEHIGFTKYGNNNIGMSLTVENKFQGKRPQYIVLSRKKELSPNNDAEIAAIKAANNSDGSVIKVVIVSKIGTEGIDFKRIREVHLLEPWFNLNRAEQIIGRAVRYCSHIDLPKSKRNVTIMFHAATYDDNEESIDLRTYRVAETKQKRIIEIENILKRNSIDCRLNKNALIFPVDKLKISFDIETSQGKKIKDYKVGDYNYTSICGYGKCVASCQDDDDEEIEIDETTFDKTFIVDDIEVYKRFIGQIYKLHKKQYLTFDQLLRYLKDEYLMIDEEVLMYTLEDMINNKTIIIDENGHTNYLIYRGNKYILQKTRMTDVRMTLEEREDDQIIRKNIPISLVLENQKLKKESEQKTEKPIEQKPEKPEEKVDEQKANIVKIIKEQLETNIKLVYPFIVNSHIAKLNNDDLQKLFNEASINNDTRMISFLKTNYNIKNTDNKKGNLYKNIKNQVDKVIEGILDGIIDRLDSTQFSELINILSKKHSNKTLDELESNIIKSLVIANVIITDKSGNIKYYFNVFTGELFCQKTGFQYKKCNPIELSKINEEYETINNLLKQNVRTSTKAYLVRMGKDINEVPVFKIKDNEKTSGYVCQKTSSLTVDDLKKRINALVPDTITDDLGLKYVKSTLCYVYEILMRFYSPNDFQRPYFIIKIDSKKKS